MRSVILGVYILPLFLINTLSLYNLHMQALRHMIDPEFPSCCVDIWKKWKWITEDALSHDRQCLYFRFAAAAPVKEVIAVWLCQPQISLCYSTFWPHAFVVSERRLPPSFIWVAVVHAVLEGKRRRGCGVPWLTPLSMFPRSIIFSYCFLVRPRLGRPYLFLCATEALIPTCVSLIHSLTHSLIRFHSTRQLHNLFIWNSFGCGEGWGNSAPDLFSVQSREIWKCLGI